MKIILKLQIIAIIIVLISTVTSAQTLSLEDCIRIAYENNRQIIKAENNVESSGKDKIRSLSSLLPRVSANASYSYGKDDVTREYEQSITDSTGQVIQKWTAKDDYDSESDNKSASLSLSQSIFNGGKNWAAYSNAKQNQKYSEINWHLTQQTIAFSVKQKYFALLKAQKLLDVADSTYQQSEKYLERAVVMDSLGLVAYGDVLKAKVNLSQDKLDQITLENNVSIAKSDLAHLLGLDIVQGVEILEIDENIEPENFDLQQCIDTALEKRPEIQQGEISVEMAKTNVRSAWGDKLPSISAYARYSWNESESKDVLNESSTTSWTVGAQASMNIFDSWGTESNIQKAKISQKNSELSLEQLEQDVILEVKQAYLSLQEAAQKIEVSQEEVDSAREDLRLVEQKYDLGKSSFIDLTDAQLGLTLARSHYVQAIYGYHLAKASLEKAMGL